MKEYNLKVVTVLKVRVKERAEFDSPKWVETLALNAAYFGRDSSGKTYEVEIVEPTRVIYDTDSSTEEVPE